MTLSVCCLTRDPAAQVAASLALFRDVADEIVVAVDFRVPVEELEPYRGVVDRLVRYEYAPPMERQLAWLHSLCTGDWILRIDGDEVPSQRLLDELPAQLAATDVKQYWHPRRWLYPDPSQFLDAPPWLPDYQLRLVRNDPAMLWFPGELHTSAAPVEPARFVEGPLYHLDTLSPYEARVAKVEGYGDEGDDLVGPSGFGPNTMYLPETFEPTPAVAPLPDVDRAQVAAVLAGLPATGDRHTSWQVGSVVGRTEIDATWSGGEQTESAMGEAFYRARVEAVTLPRRMTAGSQQVAYVRVTNLGDQPWPGGVANRPRVAVGWYLSTDRESGARVPLPSTIGPGESAVVPIEIKAPAATGRYSLVLDVLHVYQRWFGPGLEFELQVDPGDAVVPTVPQELDDIPRFATVDVVTLLVVPDRLEPFLPTLRSLRLFGHGMPVYVHAPASADWGPRPELDRVGARLLKTPTLAEALSEVADEQPTAHVFLVSEPVILPPAPLTVARTVAEDHRVASVSLFSNAASFLSLPYRNTPVPHAVASIDEAGVTAILRRSIPAPEAAPIPFATGPAVLVTR